MDAKMVSMSPIWASTPATICDGVIYSVSEIAIFSVPEMVAFCDRVVMSLKFIDDGIILILYNPRRSRYP